MRFFDLRILGLGLLFVFWTFGTSFAASLSIQNKGIYEVEAEPKPLHKEGDVVKIKKYVLSKETNEIPAVPGTHFGFEYVVEGDGGASTNITISSYYEDESGELQKVVHTEIPVKVKGGQKHYLGWNLQDDELKFSAWEFKFSYPYSKYCTFKVAQPRKPEMGQAETFSVLGGVVTRYLVRDGIYSRLSEAKSRKAELKEQGYSPFLFGRIHKNDRYYYHLFVSMHGTEEEAQKDLEKYVSASNSDAEIEKAEISLD
ncbi:SPOR domain-containing protein [Maridesulfovibrio sp.]|uniref:SPOR domain-containing protein n=1 Tax=unclassified Maridesulfovibrio TaxID=2794999 RepID=UPI003AFF90C6